MQLEAQLRFCQSCLRYCQMSQRLICLSAMHSSSVNYYDLLGVKPDATVEQIKNAFFDKSKKLHPDSDPSNPGLHGQFVQLNEAYKVLSREGSRREYDLRLMYQYTGGQAFRTSSSTYSPSAEASENMQYWQQFRQAAETQPENSAEDWEKRKKRNMRLVGYCMLTMLISLSVHYFGFRKLEEVHNNFMGEKDRLITEIYNESKERARMNGFKKQQEILRQKHTEFLEKFKIRNSGEEK